MIHARPNLNGNLPEEFKSLASDFQAIAYALEYLAVRLSCDVMHGRNYQTVADPDARHIDRLCLKELGGMVEMLTELAQEIYRAGDTS